MGNHSNAHLSEDQLAELQSGRLPVGFSHVDVCPDCQRRLRELEGAAAAYVEYRDQFREPLLPAAPQPWRSLSALIAEQEVRKPRARTRWWLVPGFAVAACAAVAIGLYLRQPVERGSAELTALLARSVGAERPAHQTISLRVHGRTVFRPAVLVNNGAAGRHDADLDRLEGAFNAAHYSWAEPLSPRSFQSWRTSLHEKQDRVSVIHAAGETQAYRVETATPAGPLRSVSLTLRGSDLQAMDGAFQFEQEGLVEVGEAPAEAPQVSSRVVAPAKEAIVETPASPADALHVLAALNRIGADVGEPIDIATDSHHVIVRAVGLTPERREQIAGVLHPLPRVSLELDAPPADSKVTVTLPGAGERNSSNIPPALRRRFENRLGGAVALQEATDRLLEASGLAVARAHALAVLAKEFSPPIAAQLPDADQKLLVELEQRHAKELGQLLVRIREDLKPLAPSAGASAPAMRVGGPWQPQVSAIVDSVQKLDEMLNQLLAGSYSRAAGEALLRELPVQLEQLERSVDALQGGGR